jgi:hypothetical protein
MTNLGVLKLMSELSVLLDRQRHLLIVYPSDD